MGLVLRERGAWFAGADLLPGVALPLVVCAVDLGQLGGRGLALDLFEEAARADRGELCGVATRYRPGLMFGGVVRSRARCLRRRSPCR